MSEKKTPGDWSRELGECFGGIDFRNILRIVLEIQADERESIVEWLDNDLNASGNFYASKISDGEHRETKK